MTLAVVLAAALACTAPASSQVVGLWEAQQLTRGGIGTVLEFRPDGSFVDATAAIVNFRYELSGGEFTVTVSEGSQTMSQKRGFKFDRGRLVVTDPVSRSTLRMDPVPGHEAAAGEIIGAWQYRHPTGAMAYERYTSDGRALLRIPLSTSTGCFVADGATISFTIPSKTTVNLAFTIDQGRLTLTGPDVPARVFGREAFGPWYDRDHIDLQPPNR